MEKLIYKDKAGNRLFKKFIKSRKIEQYYAKNREGRIINPSGLRSMLKASGRKVRVPRKIGIHKVKEYLP